MSDTQAYDTQVCVAVKHDPLKFVDVLNQEAETAGSLEPLLREAACVIANLLLSDEEWHRHNKSNANRPLALKELQGMVGEPVFIQYLRGELRGKGEWKIIRHVSEMYVTFSDKTSRYIPDSSPGAPCYGRAWLLYRRKPEEAAI